MSKWHELAERVIEGHVPTRGEALDVLKAPDAETPALLDAAYRVRRRYHGNRVRVHILMNAKSGYCPEDCGFCSQSRHAESPINKYPLEDRATMVENAKRAAAAGAYKF